MTQIHIPSLHDRAMLVYVSISCWSARKLDRKQTQKTIEGAGATADSARVNKHLLANADAQLKLITQKGGQLRDYIESNTLPWDDAGNRLLSNEMSLVAVGKINSLIAEFNALVDDFVQEYPTLRALAVVSLGDMGDDSDYPQPDVVRQKFRAKVTFSPLATGFGDVRTGMSEAQAKAWQAHFEGTIKAQTNAALVAAYGRLRENLQRYSDRLSPKEGEPGTVQVFRDTMVSNLRETCSLLNSLNVFDDPNLSRINNEVLRSIAVYEPEFLRSTPTAAAVIKQEVDAVLKRMEEFLL